MATEVVREAARTIMASWDHWDAEAGQQAQMHQLPEAANFCLEARLVIVLENLIEEAAKVCERRAECRQDQIAIYNEAMKCAAQIRHNLKSPECTCDKELCEDHHPTCPARR